MEVKFMGRMKKTSIEDWKKIAKQGKLVQEELHHLDRLLSGNVPKTVYRARFHRIDLSIADLRSTLEDRFSEEHPDDFDSGMFFG